MNFGAVPNSYPLQVESLFLSILIQVYFIIIMKVEISIWGLDLIACLLPCLIPALLISAPWSFLPFPLITLMRFYLLKSPFMLWINLSLLTCHFIVMRHHNLDQFLHFILISRGKKYTFILSSNNFVYYLCLYVVRMFAAQRYMKKY